MRASPRGRAGRWKQTLFSPLILHGSEVWVLRSFAQIRGFLLVLVSVGSTWHEIVHDDLVQAGKSICHEDSHFLLCRELVEVLKA